MADSKTQQANKTHAEFTLHLHHKPIQLNGCDVISSLTMTTPVTSLSLFTFIHLQTSYQLPFGLVMTGIFAETDEIKYSAKTST